MTIDYEINDLELKHIQGVVAAHLKSFPGFFLTFLGPAFLRELYSSLLKDRFGICLVALDKEKVVGFVAGTTRSSGVNSRLLRQRLAKFGLGVLPAILKRPSILPRLFRGIFDPYGQPSASSNRGRLMSVAVLPEVQGKGIGQQLVRVFLKKASLCDVSQVELATKKNQNEATNLFYQRLGFIMERSFTTPEGREMNQYLIELD